MRSFVSSFVQPLVEGGMVHVARPIGPRELASLVERTRKTAADDPSLLAISCARGREARRLLFGASDPVLDEASLGLAAAAHNLLALAHPAFTDRPRDHAAIAQASVAFVPSDPPANAAQAVAHHTVLARLPELTWSETTVRTVFGRHRYVGRVVPAWLAGVPRLGNRSLESTRRSWLKDVGVPTAGRELWARLQLASPLGEALDPLRLDPAPAWERLLLVVRFPALARLFAERVLEVGIASAGDTLTAALLRYAALREPGVHGVRPDAGTLATAVQFLAHVAHLSLLARAGDVGPELATLLVAAAEADATLVRPADMPAGSWEARAFDALLVGLRARAATADLRYDTARALCRRIVAGKAALEVRRQ